MDLDSGKISSCSLQWAWWILSLSHYETTTRLGRISLQRLASGQWTVQPQQQAASSVVIVFSNIQIDCKSLPKCSYISVFCTVCNLSQDAVFLYVHHVCPSVCNVGGLWRHARSINFACYNVMSCWNNCFGTLYEREFSDVDHFNSVLQCYSQV